MTQRKLVIRALRDFALGPRSADGSRLVAIRRGETRRIADPGPPYEGRPFWTTDRFGARFGLCRLGVAHGWEIVRRQAAADEQRPAQISPDLARREMSLCGPVCDTLIVGALALAVHRDAEDQAHGPDLAPDPTESEDEAEDWPL